MLPQALARLESTCVVRVHVRVHVRVRVRVHVHVQMNVRVNVPHERGLLPACGLNSQARVSACPCRVTRLLRSCSATRWM